MYVRIHTGSLSVCSSARKGARLFTSQTGHTAHGETETKGHPGGRKHERAGASTSVRLSDALGPCLALRSHNSHFPSALRVQTKS